MWKSVIVCGLAAVFAGCGDNSGQSAEDASDDARSLDAAAPGLEVRNLEVGLTHYGPCPAAQQCGAYRMTFVIANNADVPTKSLEGIRFQTSAVDATIGPGPALPCSNAPFIALAGGLSEIVEINYNWGNQPGLGLTTEPHFHFLCDGNMKKDAAGPTTLPTADPVEVTLTLTIRMTDNSVWQPTASALATQR